MSREEEGQRKAPLYKSASAKLARWAFRPLFPALEELWPPFRMFIGSWAGQDLATCPPIWSGLAADIATVMPVTNLSEWRATTTWMANRRCSVRGSAKLFVNVSEYSYNPLGLATGGTLPAPKTFTRDLINTSHP